MFRGGRDGEAEIVRTTKLSEVILWRRITQLTGTTYDQVILDAFNEHLKGLRGCIDYPNDGF